MKSDNLRVSKSELRQMVLFSTIYIGLFAPAAILASELVLGRELLTPMLLGMALSLIAIVITDLTTTRSEDRLERFSGSRAFKTSGIFSASFIFTIMLFQFS